MHAENFFAGIGLTHFDALDAKPVHGFTSPVSVLVPLLGEALGHGYGLIVQKLLSIAASVCAVVYGYLILSRLVDARYLDPAALLACGYLALEHNQILWGMAGMETEIVIAVLLGSMLYVIDERLTPAALALALCLYARPDFVVWVALAYAYLAWRGWHAGRLPAVFGAALITCAWFLPWIAFTTWYYGTPLPNTILAKSNGYPLFWQYIPNTGTLVFEQIKFLRGGILAPLGPTFAGNGTGPHRLEFGVFFSTIVCSIIVVLIVLGCRAALVERERKLVPVLGFFLMSLLYLTAIAPPVFGWYVAPVSAVGILIAAKGLAACLALWSHWSRLSPRPMVAAACLLAPFVLVLPITFTGERNIQQLVENPVRKRIGQYLAQMAKPDQTIGAESLGYIGYYSRRTVYDYPGLTNRRVVTFLRAYRASHTMAQLYRDGIGCILRCEMFQAMIEHFKPDYLALREIEYAGFKSDPARAFITNAYREIAWFRVPQADRAKLLMGDKNLDLDFVVLKSIVAE